MTLLELLVKELPRIGGWPKDADEAYWHRGHKFPNFYFGGGHLSNHAPIEFREKISLIGVEFEPDETDNTGQTVTRVQYETALAASKQPEWNGDGRPPVGVTCEHCPGGTTQTQWEVVTVLGISNRTGGMFTDYWLRKEDGSSYIIGNPYRFRPIRTEAERKREEAKNVIAELCRSSASNGHSSDLIYDAIAAGKIPGIKLVD